MAQYFYTVAGLRVQSDLAMAGLLPAPPSDPGAATADITIARAALPPAEPSVDPATEMTFDIADLMRMSMRQGSTILYDPAPDAPADDLALYLGGTGFGTLPHQRGLVLLHASAVRIGNAAVLFCGPSGAGKSTLAAAMVDAGYDHVADDFCAIDFPSNGAPTVAPDGRRHKLWESAIAGLDAAGRRGGAVRSDMTKYYVDPRRTVAAPLPIAAIFELAAGDALEIQPIQGLDLVRVTREHAYRPHLVAQMAQHRRYFDAATVIAQHCSVARLIRPMDFCTLSRTIDAITDYASQDRLISGPTSYK